ncbi:unnamed protein product [Diatraea saccharalis]|uniref:Amino acid transporter transmembrane domain-containing protein n=1 Tax=Diatraea saccharalis TaxID=40085 RepID=A0A9P0C8V4_9NEOP|nr:unnamed protein product [Diatraea saccharalis]
MSYPDLGEASVACFPNSKVTKLARPFRYIIDFVICLDLFGSCACYQLIIAKSIKQLVEDVQTTPLEGLNGNPHLRVYLAAMLIPVVLICLITHLKWLAPFSIAANFVIYFIAPDTIFRRRVNILCVLNNIYLSMSSRRIPGVVDRTKRRNAWSLHKSFASSIFIALFIHTRHLLRAIRENVIAMFTAIYYATQNNPGFENLKPYNGYYETLEFAGMIVFSMSCAGIVIPIENNMAEPHKFPLALFFGMALIVFGTMMVSFFGYVGYLEKSESPITVNFPMTV